VRTGDELRLGDGRGGLAKAVVTQVEKRVLGLEVGVASHEPPPAPAVTLAFAVPRPSRADWLMEHGTEIGVTCFQPIWTERSRPQGIRAERFRKVCAAAAGQCARAWLPEVREPIELEAFLAGGLPDVRLLAAQDGAAVPDVASADSCVMLVGPEGGFTDAEREAATAQKFAPVRFAKHILRTETAALVGAAIVLRDAT